MRTRSDKLLAPNGLFCLPLFIFASSQIYINKNAFSFIKKATHGWFMARQPAARRPRRRQAPPA